MCRHIYDWNIVNCDVKQLIHSLTIVVCQNNFKICRTAFFILDTAHDKKPMHLHSIPKFQNKNQHDYTTIVDRLQAVSWSNHSHTTSVVEGRLTFPLPAYAM